MDRKIVMLLIGIVAIGMFALPSTLAMYTGQHTFITGANVDCNDCHAGSDPVATELAAGQAHGALGCKDCHGFGGVSSGTEGHAATVEVACVACHTDEVNLHTPDGVDVADELANGAHDGFYAAPPNGDVDDACIACHTAAVVVTGSIGNAASETAIPLSNYNY